jgi:hypothetical protein
MQMGAKTQTPGTPGGISADSLAQLRAQNAARVAATKSAALNPQARAFTAPQSALGAPGSQAWEHPDTRPLVGPMGGRYAPYTPYAPNNQQIEQLRQESVAAIPKVPIAMNNPGSSASILARMSPQAQAVAQAQALRAKQSQDYYNQQFAAAASAKQRFVQAGQSQQAMMQVQALRNQPTGGYTLAKPVRGGN